MNESLSTRADLDEMARLLTCDACGEPFDPYWHGVNQINGRTLCEPCWVTACEQSIADTSAALLAELRGAA